MITRKQSCVPGFYRGACPSRGAKMLGGGGLPPRYKTEKLLKVALNTIFLLLILCFVFVCFVFVCCCFFFFANERNPLNS